MLALITPIFSEIQSAYATLLLTAVIVLMSIAAFAIPFIYYNTMLHPATISTGSQFHRILLAGFVHSGSQNLIINSAMLLLFGSRLEYFLCRSDRFAHLETGLIFIASIITSNLISMIVHRRDFYYTSTGASAGVLALIISYLVYNPHEQLIEIPGLNGISNWLMVPIYISGLLYLTWKKPDQKISHELHLLGCAAGLVIMFILHPFF